MEISVRAAGRPSEHLTGTREIIRAVAGHGVPEAAELAEAYQEACGDDGRLALP